MNRFRLLAIGTTLMLALTTAAQQAPTSSDAHGGSGGGGATVQKQLKVLTEKLDLTGDHQAKITPILREMHDATQKLLQDKKLCPEERLGQGRAHASKT